MLRAGWDGGIFIYLSGQKRKGQDRIIQDNITRQNPPPHYGPVRYVTIRYDTPTNQGGIAKGSEEDSDVRN